MLTFLAISIILGIFYLSTAPDLFGLLPEATTTTPSVTIPPSEIPFAPYPPTPRTDGSNWWEVYFTNPLTINNPADYAGSIEAKLIDFINAADTSIHIASFEFDLTPIAEALIEAKNRGVDVRWVTDDENGLSADTEPGRGQFAMLMDAGIEIRDDDRIALMNDKFWIFDGYITWTGSTDITESGIFNQNNNVIVIHSAEVASMYEREFQEMWDGQFGPRSPSTMEQQYTNLDGSPIQVLFSPEDDVINHIISIVTGAQHTIRFMAFGFTDYPLAQAMIDRSAAGVDVMGVFERVGSDTEYAELCTLHCANVPVRQDGNPSFLHDKIIIVDDTVITGSLNYSSNADESNDENVIIITNAEIAALYMQEFERIWNQAPSELSDITCP
jgi:phosphatidylserine/phosphatidylglycerophosphate/cardiolipin synthase-like enzyme